MFFSPSANSSSSTLTPQKAPKNYEAAFGALSSSYGFAGAVPILPPPSSSSSTPPKKPSKQDPPSMPSASPASPAPAHQHQPQRKNYEAAFGTLASSYGFGGALPILPTKSTKTYRKV